MSGNPGSPAALRLVSLFLLLALTGASGFAATTENWMRVATARDDSDVSLWTRHISGQQMKQFRGETHAKASAEGALSLFLDMDAMPGWLYRCDSAKILAQNGPHEYIVYLKFRGIWPLQDRDAVLKVLGSRDAKTGAVTLTGTALPDYLPQIPEVVRVPAVAATFVLAPLAPDKLRLEMTGHFDPGGVVPLWMANMVVTILPKHSLTRMSNILAGPYYTGNRLERGRKALREMTGGQP